MPQELLFNPYADEYVEKEIKKNQKQFDFDIREYPIEVIAMKFDPQKQDPEFFIPDYQREFVWAEKQQSLFIESLLIGLPIPYLFVADVEDDELSYTEGNVEIIDGAQRIQTIYAYLSNKLKLTNLERLPSLEGSYFQNLSPSRQKRLNRTTIRTIELKNIDEDGRRLMFDRLNSGGTNLTDMEKWIGTKNSDFIKFVRSLSKNPLFIEMTPLPPSKERRRERVLYALRFLAYRERYLDFGTRDDGSKSHKVIDFLEDYINHMDSQFSQIIKDELTQDFDGMLNFVKANFRFGFRKSQNSQSVSRIRFEAISVGSRLALDDNDNLKISNTSWAYDNKEFLAMIRSDASNSTVKVKNRIEFVKNHLLGNI